MIFQGEHLWPGIAGNAFIILATLFSLVSGIIFLLFHIRHQKDSVLLRFARILYKAHVVFIIFAALLLYYIIFNHYFEYNYVWKHSSLDTPVGYIISCFWAGQEGSFLIWALLQGIAALFIIKRMQKLEPVSMAISAFIQFFLLCNLLGVQLFGFQVGASPFFLLRELSTDPLFINPNYLSLITDGNGLNPLLRNPWMVTHPPLIFAGYALSAIPFAIVLAALISKNFNDVIKPLIQWTLAAILLLGIGIIIGGAWAYEALTFGGFWSWDPVENASLVPWIVLVAALHFQLTMLRKGWNTSTTFIFSILPFILVVYASFLTRSGILAETSAHSFGNDGFQHPLVFLFILSVLAPLILLLINRKKLHQKDEMPLISIQFLMYMGSIILLLSAFQIIFSTSIPVLNKLTGLNLAPPAAREAFYNKWQIPFTIAISLLIAVAQLLSFKEKPIKKFIPPLLIAIIASILIIFFTGTTKIVYITGVVSAIFAVVIGIDMLLRFYKKTSNKQALITHIGFALFLTGTILTFSNQKVLKPDSVLLRGMNDSFTLEKNKPQKLKDSYIVYNNRRTEKDNILYNIAFYKKYNEDSLKLDFNLTPYIVLNAAMGNVYEPYIKKSISKDIFSYITYADVQNTDDSGLKTSVIEISLKDTARYNNTLIILDSLSVIDTDTISISAYLKIGDSEKNFMDLKPVLLIDSNSKSFLDAQYMEKDWIIRFKDVSERKNHIILEIKEEADKFIMLKIIMFPYINLMWAGIIIMFIGILWALIHRKKRASKASQ